MPRYILLCAVCCSLGLVLAAPAAAQSFDRTQLLHSHFGYSYEAAKYKQIIRKHPITEHNVENLDGEAAVKIVEQYKNSFGGGSGGGGGKTLMLDLGGLGGN